MRVAALYDIHGNVHALDAVLDAVAAEGVDAIVSGGDVVGPFTVEVLDRLAALPHVRYVRGNADRLLLEGEAEHGVDWGAARDQVGTERLALVAGWPLTVELEVDGLGRVLFCHAVPTADEPIFTRLTPDSEVERLLAAARADVVVCGHTHVQFDRTLRSGLRVVNAGSVGMPYEGRPGAFWSLLGPDVELRDSEYDVESAAEAIAASGAPGADDHARRLREPAGADEATAFFESRRGA